MRFDPSAPSSDPSVEPLHCHILVRSDLPLEAQMAQCAHAAQEALLLASSRPDPSRPIHVVILSCPDEAALLHAAERASHLDIEHALFFEPHWPRGHTALSTPPQPRSSALKRLFAKHPLWRAPDALRLSSVEGSPS